MKIPARALIPVRKSYTTSDGQLVETQVGIQPDSSGWKLKSEFWAQTCPELGKCLIGYCDGFGSTLEEAVDRFLTHLEEQGGSVTEWKEI